MNNRKKTTVHRRKWLTLEEKLKIIESNEEGKTSTRIARELKMNESSVRSILRKKDFYKALGTTKYLHRFKCFARCKSRLILNKVERHLTAWIESNNCNRVQLTEMDIQKKALALFNELKPKGECTEKFSASRGWFYRFKNRVNLQNCVLSREKPLLDRAASAEFQQEFAKLVEKEGYTHHQIFNVEDTSLYWKKIPSLSFLLERDNVHGYKPSKDALTLSLGANAAGDLKLKPLLVYRSETPSALRDCDKDSLPVIWRSNKKAWLSKELFQEWFTEYFCPTVETYCRSQGLEFKVLLLLDRNRSHDALTRNENVKIVHLPENTAPLLQPMTLGVFPILKATYLQKILREAVHSATVSLEEFWSNYSIKDGIENIHSCWSETSPEDLAASWHHLLPEVKMKDFESRVAAIAEEVVSLGRCLERKAQDMQKVQSCNDSKQYAECDSLVPESDDLVCKEEMVEEDGQGLEQEFGPGAELEQKLEQEPSAEDLEKIMQSIDFACEMIAGCDLNIERSIKVRQILQSGIEPYRNLYLMKSK